MTLRQRRRRESAPPTTRCSFCGRPREVARPLFAGPGVYICGVCVKRAAAEVGRS